MRRLRAWIVRAAAELGLRRGGREFEDEIASHVQLHVDDNLRAGMSPGEARRAAWLALGSRGALRDEYRERAGLPLARWVTDAGREGIRSLARHRAFSLAVVGILSLGVGATAALAGLVDALLFRPPAHVAAPSRLVAVVGAPNYPLFQELERQSRTLDVTAMTTRTLTLGQGESTRSIQTQCVTSSYFRVLGASPVVGRAFLLEEDVRGGAPATVLSDALWRREFSRDSAILGRSAIIAGRPHQVVGIAPPDFRGLEMAPVDAWILLTVSPEACSFTGQSLLDSITGGWLTTVGRLRDGVALEQAEAETKAFALHALRSPGRDDAPRRELELVQSQRRAGSRDGDMALWLALGAGLILAIACANVAGLLSVRAIERRREVAVRFQLGASRARVCAQLVAEHLALAIGCTLGAWAVSAATTRALGVFFSAVVRDGWFDGRTFVVVAAFALGAGLVGGLVQALQVTRGRAGDFSRAGHTIGHARAFGRQALIVVQVALALVLVSGAGLFARSVQSAKHDLGYDLDRVLVATVDLEGSGIRRQTEKRRVFDEILSHVRTIPGVDAASLSTAAPLGSGGFSVVMPSAPAGARDAGVPRMVAYVSSDYFKTVGTRIVEGRAFGPIDRPDAPSVAIVDLGLARDLWPGESVVDSCRALAPGRPCVQIVGVSEPRRFATLTRSANEIFYPLAQGQAPVPQAILIRPSGDVRTAVPAVMKAIRSVSPSLSSVDVRPLEDLADVKTRSWRLGATLFGLFGGVAVVLASVGLYASLAFMIRQRTQEIGVRIALGATPRAIARMMLWQGGRLIGIGWALGLAGAAGLAVGIDHLLFGVAPIDPLSFGVASLSIWIAGTAGGLLPAVHASAIDPVVALRSE